MNPAELLEAVPVLIVGGSLVGLSSAMFIASRGLDCMVVERHHGGSLQKPPFPMHIALWDDDWKP
jgi:2-polyprenyl-6-methoxyphenol hydroxylase-like FAD-dependent oxidoreductase